MKPNKNKINKNLLNPAPKRLSLAALLVFIISLIIYLLTLAPTVTGEDSGEFIAAAYGGGVAHPSGYPLWTILAAIVIKIIPLGSVAYKANLLSAILSSLAASTLFIIMVRFFSLPMAVSFFGSLCFAFGNDLWSQAVITEVYTLQVFLTCIILYFVFAWLQSGENKHLYLLSFFIGLAFCNHHLTVLLIPLLFILVIIYKPKIFLSPKIVSLCLLFLLLGLMPYIYLPLAAQNKPYINWGAPDTWQKFLDHVLRRQYSDETMHAARTPHRILGHMAILWNHASTQYTLFSVPFIIVGIMYLAHNQKRYLFVTVAFFVMQTIVFFEILNPGFSRVEIFCCRVFLLPSYIVLAVWMMIGLNILGNQIYLRLPYLKKVSFMALALILTIIVLAGNYHNNDMRSYYYAIDHADNILNSLEQNAIIIPSGDHNTFPLIYRHFVEGIRPDIIIADKYGYIEYDLYKDMPDAPKKIRSRRQREEIEAFIVKNSARAVYYTVKPMMDLLPEYKAVPYGMLYRVCKKNESFDKLTPQYSYRNLSNRYPTSLDYAASVILSDYYFSIAARNFQENDIERALFYVDKSAELSEGLKEEMNNIGTLLAEFGQIDSAIGFYEEAARLDKSYFTPRWNLARLFKAKGDLLHAIQVFNDLAKLDPEDFRIFGELGFLHSQYGNKDLAIKNWGKSLAINPNQPQIIEAIGKLTASPNEVTNTK